MEQENFEPQVEQTTEVKKNKFTQVTPLSKYLAMTLFILMPFIGGWIGYNFFTGNTLSENEDIKPFLHSEETDKEIILQNISKKHYSEATSTSFRALIPNQTGNVTNLYAVTDTGKSYKGILGHSGCGPGNYEEIKGEIGVRKQWDISQDKKHIYIFDSAVSSVRNEDTVSSLYSISLNDGQLRVSLLKEYKNLPFACSMRIGKNEKDEVLMSYTDIIDFVGEHDFYYTDTYERNTPFNYFMSDNINGDEYVVVETWNSGVKEHVLYAVDKEDNVVDYCEYQDESNLACQIARDTGSKYLREAKILSDMNALVFYRDNTFFISDLDGQNENVLQQFQGNPFDVPENEHGKGEGRFTLKSTNERTPHIERSSDGRYLVLHTNGRYFPPVQLDLDGSSSVTMPSPTAIVTTLGIFDLLTEELVYEHTFNVDTILRVMPAHGTNLWLRNDTEGYTKGNYFFDYEKLELVKQEGIIEIGGTEFKL